jgi:hypothetical protein
MPSKTPKQQRAMRAAASGKGTIGIPPGVAKEFVRADQKASAKLPPPKPKAKR